MVNKTNDKLKNANTISIICIILGAISFVGSLVKPISLFMPILAIIAIILAIVNLVAISKLPKNKPTFSPRNKTIVGLVFAGLSVGVTIYILYALTYL